MILGVDSVCERMHSIVESFPLLCPKRAQLFDVIVLRVVESSLNQANQAESRPNQAEIKQKSSKTTTGMYLIARFLNVQAAPKDLADPHVVLIAHLQQQLRGHDDLQDRRHVATIGLVLDPVGLDIAQSLAQGPTIGPAITQIKKNRI